MLRSALAVVVLAGCSSEQSIADRIDALNAQVATICWEYTDCANGGIGPGGPPLVPLDLGIACMNDALASGTRAVASWAYDDFEQASRNKVYVFTIDHLATIFTSIERAPAAEQWSEMSSCAGPFAQSAQAICSAFDASGGLSSAFVIATSGCP